VTTLEIAAPAKVNLHLEVLGRRPDGYHEVRTLLQSIDWCDHLEAEEAAAGTLHLEVEPEGAAPPGDDNLVLRAARRLWGACGRQPGARLRLVKRVPSGGGLGGGSADAAAALVILQRLWSLALPTEVVHGVAAELGSDVPFFLRGGLALGVGRGDEVYPLPDLPEPLHVVVAAPPVEISTAEVYGRLGRELTWRSREASVYAFTAGLIREPRWERFRNDLQPVVLGEWKAVADVVHTLRACRPLMAAVTGSGAAAFALFRERAEAARAATAVGGECRVHLGVTLDRTSAFLGVRAR